MFEGYGSNKSVRLAICKTPGLQMWMAIMPEWKNRNGELSNRLSREEELKLLREFPYLVDKDCRCKYCRYIRMTRNWSNL